MSKDKFVKVYSIDGRGQIVVNEMPRDNIDSMQTGWRHGVWLSYDKAKEDLELSEQIKSSSCYHYLKNIVDESQKEIKNHRNQHKSQDAINSSFIEKFKSLKNKDKSIKQTQNFHTIIITVQLVITLFLLINYIY